MRSKPGFSRPCRCLSHLGGNVDRSIAPLGSRQGTDVLEDRRKIASKSRGKICQMIETRGRGIRLGCTRRCVHAAVSLCSHVSSFQVRTTVPCPHTCFGRRALAFIAAEILHSPWPPLLPAWPASRGRCLDW